MPHDTIFLAGFVYGGFMAILAWVTANRMTTGSFGCSPWSRFYKLRSLPPPPPPPATDDILGRLALLEQRVESLEGTR